ncbi:PAS domain-containing protein, partial [bacterium]|nr:PAS domain-containing protein [candidate division CSSED10-310 bacterium]
VAQRGPPESPERMLYLARRVIRDGSPWGYIRIGMPLSAVDTGFNHIYGKIMSLVVIVGLAAAAMSFLVAWQINRPIQDLIRAADRIAAGNLTRWFGTSSSIREFETLAQALRSMADQLVDRLRNETRQRNELEAIFASMVEAVIVVDTAECILRFNQAAATLFHAEQTGLSGKSILQVARNTQLHQFIRKILARNMPREEDIVLFNKEERYLRATGTAIEEGDGRIIGALIVLHDMTRLQKLERIRRDFVANVSHELKTPITAIKGFVETLLEGAVDDRETAVRFLDISLKHTNQLHAVIEDLLSLSRIEQETGQGGIALQTGKVSDVIASALSVCRVRAEAHRVALIVQCPDDLVVDMHRTLLQQALVNLIDNALKYGDDDSQVVITAETRDIRVVIHVRDRGPGIAQEHLDRLFERFYRVDKSRSRELGGSGLGLAIVKHIVQAHRGTVSVVSRQGEGSVFTISLPATGSADVSGYSTKTLDAI